jgi:DNA-binding MarR family transcriptional regulator
MITIMGPGGRSDSESMSIDRLHLAAIYLLRHVRGQEDAAGVSTARLSALRTLADHGPLPVRELAEWERVRSPTMVQVVNDLERRGQVTKQADTADARVKLVSVTPAGIRVLRKEGDRVRRAISKALAVLTPEETVSVGECAEVLYQTLHSPPPERSDDSARAG